MYSYKTHHTTHTHLGNTKVAELHTSPKTKDPSHQQELQKAKQTTTPPLEKQRLFFAPKLFFGKKYPP